MINVEMDKLRQHSIVPQILNTVPSNAIQIKYANGKTVELGNELSSTATKETPIEVKWPVENGALYTLIMTDLDAPSRCLANVLGETNHWQVANIPGSNIQAGKCMIDYAGPGPPPLTGFHRYMFTVYKQPGQIKTTDKFVDNKTIRGRMRFRNRKFAAKHNLGEPIAVNFFKTRYSSP